MLKILIRPHTKPHHLFPFAMGGLRVVLLAGLSALICPPTHAAMYLQDSLNYTAGTQLGANAPWASPYAQVTVATGGLLYPGLSDLSPAGNMISAVAATGGGSSYRAFDTTATSGTVYFSLLLKNTAALSTTSYYTLGLLPSTTTTPGGRTLDPIVLMAKSATGGFNLGVGSAGGTGAVYAASVLLASATNLVVLKYDPSSKVASLYLNPAPGGTEPGTPDATVTGTTAFSDIKHVYFRTPGGSGSWNYDTLRIASTWAEVTPPSVQVSAANSTVAVSPSSLMADGIAAATVTITARDSANIPLPGIPAGAVAVSVTGTGNTLTQPALATDANGQTTATLKSTTAEVKTISVTISGTAITSQPGVTFTNPPANQPPSIAFDGQPQSQSVLVGATVDFSVTAGGAAPLAYQWRRNHSPLVSATASSVTLTNVTFADQGSYDVVITNDYGAVTSAVAVLTVSAAPVSISASTWSTVRSGLSFDADIDEAAAGYLLTKYSANIDPATGSSGAAKSYLQFDFTGQTPNVGTPLIFTFGRFSNSGAQNVTLWALNQPFSGMRTNLTWATAQANDISNNSMLTNGPLTATALTNLVVPGGGGLTTITLPAPWGQFIQANKLVLAFTANDDAGNSANGMRITITNTQLPTLAFSVAGEQAPAISSGGQPQNQTVETGADVSLSVAVLGSLPLSYQWYFNTNTLLHGGTNAVLVLSGVTTNESGAYHVVVTNVYGSCTSAVAALTVNPPAAPSVVNDPASQSVIEGSAVSFGVTAAGSLPLSFQWYFNGSNPIANATNATLSLSSATTNDAGGYDVVVTNAYGSTRSAVGQLVVSPNTQPPTINSQPASQTVAPGANVTLSVSASGATPLSYQWYFYGTNAIASGTSATLGLANVAASNEGPYAVVVTNAYGSATSSVATLTVSTNALPVNPNDYINPRFANVTVTSGIKFADAINYKGSPVSLYLDVYQPTGDTSTNRPVIMWIHGGGFRTGSSRAQGYIVTYATDFAKRGYVCLSIDYRLRDGADMPTQESELPAEQDAAHDANTALAWIRANAGAYKVNTNWMFVAGGSAGGRIGCVLSYHEGPDTNVCTSCTSAGPGGVPYTDWNRGGVIALGDLWGSPEPVMRWYVLDSQDVPTCIIHGTADTTIPYQNSIDLYQGLTNVGVTVELHPIQGAGHTPSSDSRIEPWLANFFAQEWTKVLTPAGPTVTAPAVALGSPSGVTPGGATLNASVNPNGAATTCYFTYGLTTAYGSFSPTNFLAAGTNAQPVSAVVAGLLPGTQYHYAMVAANSVGATTSSDGTFTTPPAAPVVTSQPASDLTAGSATLNALVNPNGDTTAYYFKYGLTAGHGSFSVTNTLGAGTAALPVSAPITGLLPGTVYHFAVVAINSAGGSTSPDATLTTLAGAVYYVDSATGNDTNNGTSPGSPWKTLAKVNGTTFQPGETILFKAGGIWTGGTQLYPKGSGVTNRPIVIDKYGTGALPVIDAGTATGGGAVRLVNQQYWEVNNLEITSDAASDGDRRGVHLSASVDGTFRHLYVRNCYIHNIRGKAGTSDGDLTAKRTGGIVVEGTSSATRWDDIRIEGNTIDTVINQGIVAVINGNGGSSLNNYYPGTTVWSNILATRLVIRNNAISGVYKNGMIIRNTDESGLVEHNVLHDTATGTTGNTIFTSSCRGTVFQYNEGYRNLAGDRDGSLYDADLRSPGIVFQYSYSHDNSHGLFWTYPNSGSEPNSDVIVRYNVSQNDQGNIFSFSGNAGATASTYIYNNTVFVSATNPPPTTPPQNVFEDRAGDHTYYVYNNIFVLSNPAAIYSFSGSSRTFDYNLFYGEHPTSEPSDPHKLVGDPKLVNGGSASLGFASLGGYKLQSGSPCIDSGKAIANHGGQDLWGNAVPFNGTADRGANEYAVAITAPDITNQAAALTSSNVVLNAVINPNGAATLWFYQYGLTTNYGSFGLTNTLPAGTSAMAVSNVVTGLLAGTLYHYRVVAGNSAGLSTGLDATFTTIVIPSPLLGAPAVLSDGAFRFSFANPADASFTVLGATDPARPLTNWDVLGSPQPVGGNVYQFTDPTATNYARRFYLLQQR